MKSLCKIVLYHVVAWNMISDVLGSSLRSLQSNSTGDGGVTASAETCSETLGCDPRHPSKVLLCDKGSSMQRLFGRAKPKTVCKNLSPKYFRWLQNGRAKCGNCKAQTPAFSCQEILKAGQTSSGLYQLSGGGKKFFAYCDQKTANGGWMLFVSYKHSSADKIPLNPNVLPTDPENGYSHLLLQSLGYSTTDIQAVRFYCTTSNHPRTIHFYNTNQEVIKDAVSESGTVDAAAWSSTSVSTKINDADGNLPFSTNAVTTNTLTNYPMKDTAGKFWSIGVVSGGNYFFECDNTQTGAGATYISQDSHHQIWVRMSS